MDQKNKKPVVEMRRRMRINHSLAELRKMLMDTRFPPNRVAQKSKHMEIADTLDMAVRYFVTQRHFTQSGFDKYSAGYEHCKNDVLRLFSSPYFFNRIHDQPSEPFILSKIVKHLETCSEEIRVKLAETVNCPNLLTNNYNTTGENAAHCENRNSSDNFIYKQAVGITTPSSPFVKYSGGRIISKNNSSPNFVGMDINSSQKAVGIKKPEIQKNIPRNETTTTTPKVHMAVPDKRCLKSNRIKQSLQNFMFAKHKAAILNKKHLTEHLQTPNSDKEYINKLCNSNTLSTHYQNQFQPFRELSQSQTPSTSVQVHSTEPDQRRSSGFQSHLTENQRPLSIIQRRSMDRQTLSTIIQKRWTEDKRLLSGVQSHLTENHRPRVIIQRQSMNSQKSSLSIQSHSMNDQTSSKIFQMHSVEDQIPSLRSQSHLTNHQRPSSSVQSNSIDGQTLPTIVQNHWTENRRPSSGFNSHLTEDQRSPSIVQRHNQKAWPSVHWFSANTQIPSSSIQSHSKDDQRPSSSNQNYSTSDQGPLSNKQSQSSSGQTDSTDNQTLSSNRSHSTNDPKPSSSNPSHSTDDQRPSSSDQNVEDEIMKWQEYQTEPLDLSMPQEKPIWQPW